MPAHNCRGTSPANSFGDGNCKNIYLNYYLTLIGPPHPNYINEGPPNYLTNKMDIYKQS